MAGYRPTSKLHDFDALIVGHVKDGELTYAGKVRSGFTARQKRQIVSVTRPARRMPFKSVPVGKGGRWGEGLTQEDLDVIVWVKPSVRVRIAFVEWTATWLLRHSKYLGIVSHEDRLVRRGRRHLWLSGRG